MEDRRGAMGAAQGNEAIKPDGSGRLCSVKLSGGGKKEMRNVSITFEIMEDDKVLLNGYKPASCHIIVDVKMDFTRKARYVLDGHQAPDPDGNTYAGVVSRKSIRIALTYAVQ